MNQNVALYAVKTFTGRTNDCINRFRFFFSQVNLALTPSASYMTIQAKEHIRLSLSVKCGDTFVLGHLIEEQEPGNSHLVCGPHEFGARNEEGLANTTLGCQVTGGRRAETAQVVSVDKLAMTSTNLWCLRDLLSRETNLNFVSRLASNLLLKVACGNYKLRKQIF
jgi:hypothetical protein